MSKENYARIQRKIKYLWIEENRSQLEKQPELRIDPVLQQIWICG